MSSQKMPTALQREGARYPNHPGGISSLGMVLNDERLPWTPPLNWDSLSKEEQEEWGTKHLTPAEWEKARRNVTHALVTLSAYFPFFGIMISRMAEKQVWISSERQMQQMEGGMGIPFRTVATDGKVLYVWPQCALYHTLFEMMGLLMHELMHNLLLHPQRARGYERGLANIAMDYATNLMVNDTAMTVAGLDPTQVKLTEQHYDQLPWVIPIAKQKLSATDPNKISGYYIDEKWRLPNGQVQLFEEIYHQLQERQDQSQCMGAGGAPGQLVNDHSAWGGGRAEDENGEINGEKMTPQKMRDIVADAYVCLGEKHIGNLPAGLKRLIDNWLHPPLPWYQLLSIYMQTAPYDVHWAPGDLRCEEHSPMPWITEEPTIKYAVFGFDVSGSMSDEEIAASVANARAILRGWPNMKGLAIFWDAVVGECVELSEFNGAVDRGICGGGGTRIAPLFEKLKELGVENDVAVVVDFTDGYVPWDEVDPNTLKYDVLWVITNETEKPPTHHRYRHTVLNPGG